MAVYAETLLWAVSRVRHRCSRPRGKAVAPLGQHRLWPRVPFQLSGTPPASIFSPQGSLYAGPQGHWGLRAATPASGLRDNTQVAKLVCYCHLPCPHCPLKTEGVRLRPRRCQISSCGARGGPCCVPRPRDSPTVASRHFCRHHCCFLHSLV